MQLGLPESSSAHAAEGTAMHEVGEIALSHGCDVFELVGQKFLGDGSKDLWFELTPDSAKTLNNGYILPVRQLAEGGILLVEERLSISHITNEEGAHGTSDTVILTGRTLIIADLKWGMGVQVDAEDNDQLSMYALAAYERYSLIQDFDEVLMIIFQPRLNHVSEWRIPLSKLLAIGERLKVAADTATRLMTLAKEQGTSAIPDTMFAPSQDNCRWCKVKSTCASLRNFTLSTILDDFDDESPIENTLTKEKLKLAKTGVREKDNNLIAVLMSKVDLIMDWCKAVVAHGEAEIHAGRKVPGYKLVQGKRGNRKWSNVDNAEAVLKSMKLKQDEMYKFSLISPTDAESLLKDISPKRWNKLQAYITQSPGSPTVVPESDKRPEIVVTKVEDEFKDETFDDLV